MRGALAGSDPAQLLQQHRAAIGAAGCVSVCHPTSAVLACDVLLPLGTFTDAMQQLHVFHELHALVDAEIAREGSGAPVAREDVSLWKFWRSSNRFIVAAGVPATSSQSCSSTELLQRLLRLAGALNDIAAKMVLPDGNPLRLRQALHTGQSLSAIVGIKRSFNLYGEAAEGAEQLLGDAPAGSLVVTDKSLSQLRATDLADAGLSHVAERPLLWLGASWQHVWHLQLGPRAPLAFGCPIFAWQRRWAHQEAGGGAVAKLESARSSSSCCCSCVSSGDSSAGGGCDADAQPCSSDAPQCLAGRAAVTAAAAGSRAAAWVEGCADKTTPRSEVDVRLQRELLMLLAALLLGLAALALMLRHAAVFGGPSSPTCWRLLSNATPQACALMCLLCLRGWYVWRRCSVCAAAKAHQARNGLLSTKSNSSSSSAFN